MLDELGLKHGTDKASNGHDYLHIYEQYLSRAFDPVLLEVGWWKGESIRMWRDYFPSGTIVGVDLDAKTPVPGTHFRKADQADKVQMSAISREFGPWDVVVDDASHISPLTISTFKILWPHLKPGGLYFVEDLQVSYHPDWMGNPNPEGGRTIMQFLRKLADSPHHGHATVYQTPAPAYDVQHVAFYPGLCVVQKKETP